MNVSGSGQLQDQRDADNAWLAHFVYVFVFCIWIYIWNLYFHQANYKINAMRIMFDLHTFKQKKIYQNMRAEQEMSVRYFLRRDICVLRNLKMF